MRLVLVLLAVLGTTARTAAAPRPAEPATTPPIYVAFLWHMHQPIYWPYESVLATDANARYPYSIADIHNQRTGPYTTWPWAAVQKGIGAGMPHFGAQVSFSGSLIENLDNLEAGGNGNFSGWRGSWTSARAATTSLGHPRIDLVGFGYHHPLMGLIDSWDIEQQIAAHRDMAAANFGGGPSHGIFPPENAFAPRMIPALVAEGLQWVLIDNIHFDRAATNYPFSTSGNVVEPNRADQRNADPGDWVQLNGLWAPTRVSGGWGHRPHFVQYRDPATGTVYRMIGVPAERYMGNEDGRGGFGALQYDAVMSQLQPYNTDAAHPLLVVLHHDGDNYGGGTDAYYGGNFQSFVDWLQVNPSRFVCTTIEDYLQMFPPDTADVIHAESGSWSGADNGDPEFKKWLGDPDATGYSPDRNSWAVVTAAKNIVQTAEQVAPGSPGTQSALHVLLNAEASDYWYWDGSQGGLWDSHPTRAANLATQFAQPVAAGGTDLTPPAIFVPQREPYNPGGTEWGVAQPSDFDVWSYVYDLAGLSSVTVKYRLDGDGLLSVNSPANDTYAGGAGVGAWTSAPCAASDMASQTNPAPTVRAMRYTAHLTGLTNQLVDYCVEATDVHGNLGRSPIQHVWVGATGGTGTTGVSWTPLTPASSDSIRITVGGATQAASLHWGVNAWTLPATAYRPPGTTLFNGTGPSVETPMNLVGGNLVLTLGPFDNAVQAVTALDFVIHYANNTWDNNNGQDYHVTISRSSGGRVYAMDGVLDAGVAKLASNAGVDLYADWNGSELYVATQAAPGVGQDVFVLVAGSPGAMIASPWAKAGQTAAWAAFIGNESGNNYCGWTDASGAANPAAGTMVEGKLDLAQELGGVPATVHIAVARYGTADSGTLQAQCPAGNGNGNVEAAEYYAYPIGLLAAQPPPAGSARLMRVAPSPVRDAGRVSFDLARESEVRLEVFDSQGRRAAVLAQGVRSAGSHAVRLEAAALGSGVYFARLTAGNAVETRRFVVLR